MNGLLVVDDEEGVRRAVQKALGRENYEVFTASSGNEAILIVKDHPAEIAICISDFKMPGLDGLQTLAAIGTINPEITRIMLTGYATLEGAIAATNEGIDGFLTKPFDNVELRAKVREYFVRKRLKQFVSPQVMQQLQVDPTYLTPRKQRATLVFVDIRGFTALTEKHDPQEWALFLSDNYFSPLGEIIFQNNGTLDKHIGDGIMAIFGAPLAHENDPERAVRCSLEMVSDIERFNALSDIKLPAPLGLHVGLHSGWVIAGNVGSDLRMNYSVVGDTVNLASRLVELAPPGEIYMSAETFKLVSTLILTDGPFTTNVKGKAEPVSIYKLRSLKIDADRRKVALVREDFVGREREMQLLRDSLDIALHKKEVRIFIRGEAGVGKTRIKRELMKMAHTRGVATIEGMCSSFEVNTPYFLWNTLLKSMLRIGLETSEVEARIRLHELLSILSLEEHEPYLATLLSLRYGQILMEEEEHRKKRIFEATASLLRTFAARRPSVFILEDLHWIDRFSQELLEYILTQGETVPTMVVCLFRDEYTQAKNLLHLGELLDLNRLPKEDACKLMSMRLDVDTIPPNLELAVLTRSEGNPFFIQEILKTLLDKNVIAVRQRKVEILTDNVEAGIPGTVQGVIMARIDRIQESIKDVLFGASVIGREFSRPILEQVVDRKGDLVPQLHELQTLELILAKEEADEADYLFKHYLIQEVAYNTILINKRKELHASIAQAIEKLYPDRLMEFYELLAFHYEKAELWDKAAEYLGRSGHKVRQIYSREESKEFFRRKEAAMQKLFQSGSASWSFWATFKAITPPLIAMLIPILPIFYYIRILGRSAASNQTELIVVGVVASALCLWYLFTLWHLGVTPFLRGKPKLYDLMEDQVRVLFPDGTNLSIQFIEIDHLRYFDPEENGRRSFFRKLIDPFSRIEDFSSLTFGLWFREVVLNIFPPYSFGFGGGQGEVHVRLKEGYRGLRMVIPWFNTPVRSKDMSLLPFAPREFFEQMDVAFANWKRMRHQP